MFCTPSALQILQAGGCYGAVKSWRNCLISVNNGLFIGTGHPVALHMVLQEAQGLPLQVTAAIADSRIFARRFPLHVFALAHALKSSTHCSRAGRFLNTASSNRSSSVPF